MENDFIQKQKGENVLFKLSLCFWLFDDVCIM